MCTPTRRPPRALEVLEPTGSAVLITVDVGDEALKVAAPATFRARPGDVVYLTFPPEAMRLYDAETHDAIGRAERH